MIGQYRFGLQPQSGKPVILPGRLSLFSSGARELLAEIELGKLSLTMRATEDGATGFVANCHDGTVSVIDLTSRTLRRTLQVETVYNEANKNICNVRGLAIIP